MSPTAGTAFTYGFIVRIGNIVAEIIPTMAFRPLALLLLLSLNGCRVSMRDIDLATAASTLTLADGALSVDVALPDPLATRFDQSAQLLRITLNGRTFLWALDDVDRGRLLAINAEEFSPTSPPGYDVGDRFLKIGVGVLRREDAKSYHFDRRFEHAEPSTWRVAVATDRVRFTQTLRSGNHAVRYQKTLTLDGGRRQIHVRRHLINLGDAPIDTEHYAHHFIRFNGHPLVAGDEIRLDFDATPVDAKLRNAVDLAARRIRFTATPPENKAIYVRLNGDDAAGVTLIPHRSETALHIRTTPAADWWVLFALNGWLSPEPFTRIRLAPDESVSWSTTYTFTDASP
jgi:hypothetical protein